MPSTIVDQGALVRCPHQSPATLIPKQTRVKIDGRLVLTSASQLTVSVCPFTVPGPKSQPCGSIRWTGVAARVKVAGSAPLLMPPGGTAPAQGIYAGAVPQGPAVVTLAGTRVQGK